VFPHHLHGEPDAFQRPLQLIHSSLRHLASDAHAELAVLGVDPLHGVLQGGVVLDD
jgi:hypothetical protein